jgi:chromosome segregation ATPase
MFTELEHRINAQDSRTQSILELNSVLSQKSADLSNLLKEQRSDILSELETLRAVVSANTEIVELRNCLETERMRRKDMEQSWSWRLTAPARFLLGKFRNNRVG